MSDFHNLTANVLGSAFAGIVGRIFTHPLDTAKARVQAQLATSRDAKTSESAHRIYRGPMDALVRTSRTEGIIGLYRGFGAILVGGTPGTIIYLCSYDVCKERLSRLWGEGSNQGNGEFLVHFCSGMVAESVACVIYVPVDVIKERLQIQGSGNAGNNYRGSFDALRQIARHEGIGGIYKGYGATLASFGPFSALYFVFYERFKLWARQYHSGGRYESADDLNRIEIPFPSVVVTSASAGALASWLTSPLDMAKLRLQVQRGNRSTGNQAKLPTVQYSGIMDCLRTAHREGGIPALFRGAGARVLHFAPATAITMTCYETCRSAIVKLLKTD